MFLIEEKNYLVKKKNFLIFFVKIVPAIESLPEKEKNYIKENKDNLSEQELIKILRDNGLIETLN